MSHSINLQVLCNASDHRSYSLMAPRFLNPSYDLSSNYSLLFISSQLLLFASFSLDFVHYVPPMQRSAHTWSDQAQQPNPTTKPNNQLPQQPSLRRIRTKLRYRTIPGFSSDAAQATTTEPNDQTQQPANPTTRCKQWFRTGLERSVNNIKSQYRR